MKRYRRPKLKEGELRAYYGKLPGDEPDIVIDRNGIPRCDGALLYYHLATQRFTHIPGEMMPCLIDELEARGYDITTLKFSIMKKQAAA